MTPPGRAAARESPGTKWPFRKTRRVPQPSSSPRSKESRERPFGPAGGASRNRIFASGARFVYFQSSSRVVGKPRSAKRAMASLREDGRCERAAIPLHLLEVGQVRLHAVAGLAHGVVDPWR
jgi:hypothetical protein